MNLTYRLSSIALAGLGTLTLSACQFGDEPPTTDFVSDDPTAGDYGEEGGLGTGGEEVGDEGGDPSGDGDGDNGGETPDISEADIIQLEGDRLYALSTYSGLTVVDMQDPDDLRALGAWEADAQPFEMYVDNGQAFVMFNDYGFWEWNEEGGLWDYASSSRLIALDASDPADISVKGEFTLPGRIQDSRRVGDVLYVVTMQDGWCWDCDVEQKTVVTSLDISDQAHPAVVDQLEFTAPDDNWDWQRSVESTTERMYVAARSWGSEGMGSFIDVVDISAGDGTLAKGAQVEVAGSVFSRWQMNEYADVLRVISQPGWGEDPLIETFEIESPDSFIPLGTGNLTLPEPESLRSARFDGDRAYAITAEQTDPLFTIDLSDPANPHQVGELEIPGWVYHMETRDDRILALGFDPANEDGSINVSLFDVGDFAAPALLERVHFGGDWASFAEDQNRIHKAFSILDDEQMILVPHTGWDWDEGGAECSSSYRSGVQIIDWLDDTLALRGLVPSRGRPRRAFTHNQRIVTVSDVELATYTYADRDNPAAADELTLAVHVDNLVHAGDVWVRMARNWWTSEQLLEIVDGSDPGAPEPIGFIDLGQTEGCQWSWVEDLFAIDDHVFVVRATESWDQDYEYTPVVEVVSVDVSDPSAPVIDDLLEIPGQRGWGIGSLANVATQSSWMAQHGEHAVFLTEDEQDGKPQVHVLDLSDPANLTVTATLERPDGQAQGQLSVMSDTVVSWHTEPVEGQPGKVRFYFDRLELDGGQPHWAAKINVPGIIVAYDADAGRAYTVDFSIHEVQTSSDDCYEHPKYWRYDYEQGTCELIERTLERLEIAGGQASLSASIDIEGDAGLAQLYATDSRIFAQIDKSWWEAVDEYDGVYHYDNQLVLVDVASGSAEVHSVDGEDIGQWWSLRAVDGERAVVQANYGELVLIDATEVEEPAVQHSSLPGWGSCYNPVLDGEQVYCPMGPYGLETVDW